MYFFEKKIRKYDLSSLPFLLLGFRGSHCARAGQFLLLLPIACHCANTGRATSTHTLLLSDGLKVTLLKKLIMKFLIPSKPCSVRSSTLAGLEVACAVLALDGEFCNNRRW